MGLAPGRTADSLLKQALDGGAPDNVTLVIVDVGGQHPIFSGTPTIVGSASNPVGIEVPAARPGRTSWLHPNRQAANEPSHFEPAAEFLEELIEEDRRRAKRRRIGWIVGLVIVLAMMAPVRGTPVNTASRDNTGAIAADTAVIRALRRIRVPQTQRNRELFLLV